MSKRNDIAKAEYAKQMLYSKFNPKNLYTISHPDALSDGDENGKGLFNGSVGSKTDIKTRNANMAKNPYGPNNEYKVVD